MRGKLNAECRRGATRSNRSLPAIDKNVFETLEMAIHPLEAAIHVIAQGLDIIAVGLDLLAIGLCLDRKCGLLAPNMHDTVSQSAEQIKIA